MYRDVALELDEHDGAVGAILIAESLVAGCERAAKRVNDPNPQVDPWRSIGDAQFYGEIWRHLDRAKQLLRKRGTNTATYDELRPHAKSTIVGARKGNPVIDTDALDEARRAIEALKLAIPGADWVAIEKRSAGLVAMPQLRQRSPKFLVACLGAFGLASVAWMSAWAPRKKPEPKAVAIRNELIDIANNRKDRIADLQTAIGSKCEPRQAHELVEALALDGRADEARAWGDDYNARCGEDIVVLHWAHAPKIRSRR